MTRLQMWAIAVLVIGFMVSVGATLHGFSPGHNRFRVGLEVLALVLAVAAVIAATTAGSRRRNWAVVAVLSALVLALLELPMLAPARVGLLAGLLPGQDRGFVLAALGRPDLSDGGIGVAHTYAFQSVTTGRVLVVQFRTTSDVEDKVDRTEWMDEATARTTYGVSTP